LRFDVRDAPNEFQADYAAAMANRAERSSDPRLHPPVGAPEVDPDVPPWVLGSYAMALAVAAAAHDVDEGLVPLSLHAAFLREGIGAEPLRISVESMSNGRRLARRGVRYSQRDRDFFACEVGFHRPETVEGLQSPPRSVPSASSLSTAIMYLPAPVMEVRPVGGADAKPFEEVVFPFWARFPRGVPTGSHWSAAALVWASDYFTASAMGLRSGWAFDRAITRTLEHSMWFHRPVDVTNWMLVDADALSQRDRQFLAQGTIHAENGEHVATFTQAGLITPLPRP
jgi:acyl-CoA thioesterase II